MTADVDWGEIREMGARHEIEMMNAWPPEELSKAMYVEEARQGNGEGLAYLLRRGRPFLDARQREFLARLLEGRESIRRRKAAALNRTQRVLILKAWDVWRPKLQRIQVKQWRIATAKTFGVPVTAIDEVIYQRKKRRT